MSRNGTITAHVSTSAMGLEQHLRCLQGSTQVAAAFRKALLKDLGDQLEREFGDTPLELRDAGERETFVDPGGDGDEETAAALGQWLDDWEGTAEHLGRLRAMGAGLTAAARERATSGSWRRA